MPIRTANGLVEPAEVRGLVLAHEHLAIDLSTPADAAAPIDDAAAVRDGDAVAAELAEARELHGLGLVVDLTCRGMGRDAAASARIAARAGVEVVVATGYYYERFHPAGDLAHDAQAVAASLVEEATTGLDGGGLDGAGPDGAGLDGSGILPGVLGEIGSSGEATPAERTSLTAAGIAAQQLGLSVSTHAHLGQGGLEQLDLLTATGLDPRRIAIGHQDLIDAPEQHRTIAASGAYVAFDTVGKESYQPDAVRLRLLLELLEAGYARQILLSNDISRDGYLVSRGGQGFCHVLGPFREALVGAGVDEPTLAMLYRDNPLRWLEGA